MPTLLSRICWMEKYDGPGVLQCVRMRFYDEDGEQYKAGGEMWNFYSCEDGKVRGYVMLSAKNKAGEITGTININKLGAKKTEQFIEGVNVIFFAMNPEDEINYVVGWYNNAIIYRNWLPYSVDYPNWNNSRPYSFEVLEKDVYLIPENDRNIKIITAKSPIAIERGGSFPGMSGVFFGSSNESYAQEILEQVKLNKLVEETTNDRELSEDLKEIKNQEDTTITEKQRLIAARVGQGLFRKRLIELWQSCAITQCDEISILRASHIKPWRNSNNKERLNVYNGLLLTPNLDGLFDKGFISFEDNGKIIISEKISGENMAKLGVDSEMKISVHKKHIRFIKWHRENILIK